MLVSYIWDCNLLVLITQVNFLPNWIYISLYWRSTTQSYFIIFFLLQGCESSSFLLISSFLKIFFCQNFSFFLLFSAYFCHCYPIFPCLSFVASHTPGIITDFKKRIFFFNLLWMYFCLVIKHAVISWDSLTIFW